MKRYQDFKTVKVDKAELEKEASRPVLNKNCVSSPVIIESIELLYNYGLYFVRTISKDGYEGISVASSRAKYLYPILEQLVIPYFVGKDARDLDELIDGVYVYKSNYKLTGLALWCCVSWVEASILDMLGKIAKKSVGRLLGEKINDHVSIYVASGRRNTTPEEEVALIEERVAQTQARAIKFKVGGRMSKNADSMEGRSEGLIYLARKHFGDDIAIHADGNGSYDPPKAIQIGKMLEEINAYFYEEPCPLDIWRKQKKLLMLWIFRWHLASRKQV
jgi:L-alanine-DL-glutamate epimerase-like enolase superfamily enzyme